VLALSKGPDLKENFSIHFEWYANILDTLFNSRGVLGCGMSNGVKD